MESCLYDCGYIFKSEFEEVDDVFEISKRVKLIDENYVLLYNHKKQRYELHNLSQKNSTFVFSLPFEFLDVRFLDYIYVTKQDNCIELFNKIEFENMQIEHSKNEKINNFANNLTKEALLLAEKKGGSLNYKDIEDIKKVMKEN